MEHREDEEAKLGKKVEVEVPLNSPLEAPPAELLKGPYYMSAEERTPAVQAASPSATEEEGLETGRRDFLRILGLSMGAAACVRRPEEKLRPLNETPIDHIPGVAKYYSSTCAACPAGCGIKARTIDGRVTKLEGLPKHPISQGGLCAAGQASIQEKYHPERYQAPHSRGTKLSWDLAFTQISNKIKETPGKVGIFTNGSTGHRHGFMREFLKQLGSPEENLFTWESNHLYATLSKAHEIAFGMPGMPRFELRHARYIFGIASDFEDIGISPVYMAKGFSQAREPQRRHKVKFTQVESRLSQTGASADERHVVPPGNECITALLLLREILKHPLVRGSEESRKISKQILWQKETALSGAYDRLHIKEDQFKTWAQDLLSQPSLVLAGGSANFDKNSTKLQLITILINSLTGAYGKTLHFDRGELSSPVDPESIKRFREVAPTLQTLIVIDTDPIFPSPPSSGFKELFTQIPNIVSIQAFPNEVDKVANYSLPGHHFLEAWGDEQTVAGFWSIRQPVMRPISGSRQAEDILLWLLAYMDKNLPYKTYQDYLKQEWQKIAASLNSKLSHDLFFRSVLRKGFVGRLKRRGLGPLKDFSQEFRQDLNPSKLSNKNHFWLTSPLDHRIHDGKWAHLPILQEIGDALTTITWDSWLALNPEVMAARGLRQNQVVELRTPAGKVEVAVFPLPGLHPSIAVFPRGGGHDNKDSTISYKNGVNPLPLFEKVTEDHIGFVSTSMQEVELIPTDKFYRLAALQKKNDLANRHDIVKKMSWEKWQKHKRETKNLDKVPDLYPKLEEKAHRWGMSIDLSKCTGCGACMVACGIENNVPQVGRSQVLLGREMHWIRLDRYFYGPTENPKISFQPMLCQHCNHAPCEAVCPVYATTHDAEGMNSMTYNRCVGTRYCANACPYKVRRFNWWTHGWGKIAGGWGRQNRELDRNPRALNARVTVRTRGVMEKCSFCVQRLQEAKREAKLAGGDVVHDGKAKTACQQTCPSDAIIFGNLNDRGSAVSQSRRSYRAYLALGGDPDHGHFGIKTLPNVNYLAEIHRTPQPQDDQHHAHGKHHDPASGAS